MMSERSFAMAAAVAAVLLAAAIVAALIIGSVPVDIVKAFSDRGSPDAVILFSIRLPRVAAALLAGAAFAISGLMLQSAASNDLASPNIIGMNSGAGSAVLLFLSLFPDLFALLPLVAFLGGLMASALVFIISTAVRRVDGSGAVILAGIAVNALFNALISTFSSLYPETLASYSSFSVGGFSSISSDMLYAPGLLIAIAAAVSFSMCRSIDILALGDEISSSMGLRPYRIRAVLVVLSALIASSAVSFSGLLGFVGLVTPHIALFISGGGRSRRTMLLCLLIGPLLVLLSDLLARTVASPGELPAGVFMAAIGVPFFIFLLIRRARS